MIVQRVTIAIEPRRVILAANRKRDWTGGKIEQVAVKGRIVNWQLIFAGILQVHINLALAALVLWAVNPRTD